MDAPTPVPSAPPRRRPWLPGRGRLAVLAAVALGGGLGSAARYGAFLLWPVPAHGFPWTTLGINLIGCALIGVLMGAVAERTLAGGRAAPPLARPFLGTGVLGGFTTFSTYAQDGERLLSDGRPGPALAYLALTLAAALPAAWLGARTGAWLGAQRRSRGISS